MKPSAIGWVGLSLLESGADASPPQSALHDPSHSSGNKLLPQQQGPRSTTMLVAVVGVDCSGSLSRRNSSMRVRIVVKSSAARGRDIKPSGPRITKRGMVSPKTPSGLSARFLVRWRGPLRPCPSPDPHRAPRQKRIWHHHSVFSAPIARRGSSWSLRLWEEPVPRRVRRIVQGTLAWLSLKAF